MLTVFLIMTGVSVSCHNILLDRKILAPSENSNDDTLESCLMQILKKHYAEAKFLTFIDMNYDDDRLLQAVHTLALLSVVQRKPRSKSFPYNGAYLVTAGNVTDFTKNFEYLTHESTWNPYAKFIVVVRTLKEAELRKIFDILMKYRVLNVIVVNGTDLFLYTYNPYENYACGKYYNRIIKFDSCDTSVDFYPIKMTTGLRRCTVSVAVPHWPPYTINPSRIEHGMLAKGVEQKIVEIMGEREDFNITYIYTDNGEDYSIISEQMIASGPLEMLQNNETDLMMGGILLSPARATAFSYTSSHLDKDDEIKIIVKRASYKPAWKNFYLEFEPVVWLLLLISLVSFGILMILLLRIRDKSYFFLMLTDMLYQHGYSIRCRWSVKCVLIFWVWFAYLMNCFYQSNLSSLTTKPGRERQVSDIEDINSYNLKPCVSSVMKYLLMERNSSIPYGNDTECNSFLGSITKVSKSDQKYTVVLHSVYNYQKHEFYDEYGNDPLYTFDTALFRVSYGIFMNKGFPLNNRLYILTLRLRENGLVVQNCDYQYYMLMLENKFKHKNFTARFVAPWYLYTFGVLVSTIAFISEILSKLKALRN